jgi:predicted dehydrogenase
MQPIKTAMCAFGMSGRVFHAPFITNNSGFELYGVYERTKNDCEKLYPTIKTFRSLDEMLADEQIELVIVNTPNLTHFEYTKKALLAGKHVVVEKPFTSTVEEASELIEIAQSKNLLLSVFQNRRFDSDFLTVKKVLDQDLLGSIVEASIHFDRFVPALSYKTHKEIVAKGVGTIYDLGSHIIDQALCLFGMPDAVFADLMTNRPGSVIDDYFEIRLYYPEHRVILKSSYYVRESLPGFVLHGKLGSFLKHRADVQEADLQSGKSPSESPWGKEPDDKMGFMHTEINEKIVKEFIPTELGNYGNYYQGIFDAIRNGAKLPVTAEDGKNVIAIIEAAIASHEQKTIINPQLKTKS